MRRAPVILASTLLLATAVGCSSSGSAPTASPTITSSDNQIACNYYVNMAGAIDTITASDGTSNDSLRVGEAQRALSKAKSSMIEIQKTANTLPEATALKMDTYLFEFGAYLETVQPNDDVSAIDKTSPSPSPATTTVQSDIRKTYEKIGQELGC